MRFSARENKDKVPTAGRRYPGRRWQGLWLLLGCGLFVLGLLAGLYLFFPAEVLKQRIIQEAEARIKAQVEIKQVALYPLLTLDIDQLNISMSGLPQPLEIDELQIAPLWSSLLSDPGARLQAKGMNGTLAGVVQKSGALSAEAAGLRFDLPLQEPLPCNITGTLSEAQLDTVTGLKPDTKTSLSLRLNNVMIIGLASLDADNKGIPLGEITLQAEGQGRNMQIKSLAAKGGVLDVGGEGTLLVGRSAATSRIKLALQVSPGPNANPTITSMLQLAGEADAGGRYTLRVSGTLAKPVLKPGE
jgi:type II secretion system protein N